jgi:hypothetical protein
MFPNNFAFEVVNRFTKPGDAVFDPFAGRGTSVYAAVAQNREGYGIEINPVGWLYGHVKLKPQKRKELVLSRIDELAQLSEQVAKSELDALPEFFHVCYSRPVLKYLLTARAELKWKKNKTDATLMAMLLVNLHGRRGQCLSNQMRQSKAMSPAYSIAWWKSRNLSPPEIDPAVFMKSRIEWRYAKSVAQMAPGEMVEADSTTFVAKMTAERKRQGKAPFKLLFTSPPYCGITNYYYDQWLRRWLLGGPEIPTASGVAWAGKFESKAHYRTLLETVFQASRDALASDAAILVRTDARQFTYTTTCEVLREIFPEKRFTQEAKPFSRATQTALFGDKENKPGEIDILLSPDKVSRKFLS